MKYIIPVLFVALALTLIGCGKSAEDYMKDATEKLKAQNVAEAVASYQKILEEFPQSEQAPDALYQLATIYQGLLLPNLSREESLIQAVTSFKTVYEKYPKNKYAPVSLFMSGFIMANELHQYEEATKTYNLFIDKFPDHQLASSARDELDNMGLAPDEILKKKGEPSK
ncbi:MAG: tetratricopeptide repeat protein [Ignavibacteriaceae bacterium]|nr:tetratricopeptide repeat protein [Ignavibacteriaceae bacterium]